jgi:hypothetical protein
LKDKDNLQEVQQKNQNYLGMQPALFALQERIRYGPVSWIVPIQRNARPACPSCDDVQKVTEQKLRAYDRKEHPVGLL